MTTKARALQAIESLPEDATLSQIMDQLRHLEREGAREPEPPREPEVHEESVWTLLRRGTGALEMPSDWASEHDHYLYGTPRRSRTP